MLWLITQVAVFLAIAFVVGLLIGWLLRSLWPSSRSRVRESEMQVALQRAGSRITDLEAGLRSKSVAATAAAEQEEAARRRVEELEAALATLDSQGDADTGELDRLQVELDQALGSISSMQQQMAGLDSSAAAVDKLRDDHDRALRRIAELEAALADGTGPAHSQAGLFDAAPEPKDELDPEQEEALRLEAQEAVTERFRQAEPGEPDDLKRIRGIGPVLERMLYEMNITTFPQIAEFTDDDIDLVSRALGRAFPDRVRRDDWVGGAQEILRQAQEDGP